LVQKRNALVVLRCGNLTADTRGCRRGLRPRGLPSDKAASHRLLWRTKTEKASHGIGFGASALPAGAALSDGAVALPAAVLDEAALPFFGVAGGDDRIGREGGEAATNRRRIALSVTALVQTLRSAGWSDGDLMYRARRAVDRPRSTKSRSSGDAQQPCYHQEADARAAPANFRNRPSNYGGDMVRRTSIERPDIEYHNSPNRSGAQRPDQGPASSRRAEISGEGCAVRPARAPQRLDQPRTEKLCASY